MADLEVGDRASDFELPTGPDETVRLSDVLADHEYAVIAFFPAIWSPTCSNELDVLEAVSDEIERLGAGIIAVSTDNCWSTREFANQHGLSFPLASDFEPKGEVAMQFGAYHPRGVCARMQLIVDGDRTVVFRYDG